MLISKSKRNHLSAFFQENLNNSKKLWNKINELINKKQKEMDDIFLSENSAMITKQRIVANTFNKYFINVAYMSSQPYLAGDTRIFVLSPTLTIFTCFHPHSA